MARIRIDYAQGKAVEFEQRAGRIARRAPRRVSEARAGEDCVVAAAADHRNPRQDSARSDSSRPRSSMRIRATLDEIPASGPACPIYAMLTARLCAALAVEPEDVQINWAEVKKENWSFGRVRAPS
jgi:Tautomerase enzyme